MKPTPLKNLGLILLAGLITSTPLYAVEKDPQLDAQVTRYWTAQAKRDWPAAYELLSAEEKASITAAKYAEFRKKTGVFDPINTKIIDSEIIDNLAWVLADFDAKVWRFPDAPARHGQLWQLWQKTDSWHVASEAERQQHPLFPPKLRLAAEESTLGERAKKAWQAKESQDWKSFYTNFLPPDYRALVSVDQFLQKKAQYAYSAIHLDWAEVTSMIPEQGSVKMTFAIKPNDPIAAKLDAQERTNVEKWIKQKGEWYLDIPLPKTTKTAAPKDSKGAKP